jgi:hypothetical protein
VLIPQYKTCKKEDCLSLNTLSFLHSHRDQIKTIAPTLICFLNLLSILLSQLPKILAILRGGYKVEATWMIDHIERVKRHWKKRCLIVSSWGQKTHFLQPYQFRFARLSLVKITPLRRYHPNTFIRSGIFNFQSLLLLTSSNEYLVGSEHCTWKLQRIYHSHEDSNEIRHVQVVAGYSPNVEVRRSKIQVSNPINLFWTIRLEVKSPKLWQ